MRPTVHGMHHLTAIAGEAQENLNFYTGVMGLRLVKKSVNQDVPDTYHLFYADGAGTPGTDLTFFPWPEMGPGQLGTGLVVEVPFAVPRGSLKYWRERFDRMGVQYGALETRFEEATLPFTDPDGLPLALVESEDAREFVPWQKSPVPAEHQLRGLHTVRLWVRRLAPTAEVLINSMGFTLLGRENGWSRYLADGGGSGKMIEIKERPQENIGRWGIGAVHHVAWRMKDDAEEMAMRQALLQAGLFPTGQIDRFWFKSVYFREPGGVLFELATDGPGFDRDEEREHLGEQLILPPWLESQRSQIEAALPPLVPMAMLE